MLARLTPATRTLVVLCLAAWFWSFSFGLGAPLASLWLRDADYSEDIVGLNTGTYYLGIALAAGVTPFLMRRLGRGCLVIGMVGTGVTCVCFPWGDGLVGWFTLRLLNGFAGAFSLIPLETLVNRNSPAEHRARDFGYYAFSVALGIASGTLAGTQLYSTFPGPAFLIGGLAGVLAALTVLWLEPTHIEPDEQVCVAPIELRRNFLSFGSAWSQGFLEGGMIGLLPIYLLSSDLSESGVGWTMSSIMVGVILFQVPVAWLADRLGRTKALLGCYAVTLGTLAALSQGMPLGALFVCLFFAGACSSAFYPLGLSLVGERTPAAGLARANSWFLGINCLGSLIGPAAAGWAMKCFGKQSLFAAGLLAVFVVLVAWLGLLAFDYVWSLKDIPVATTVQRAEEKIPA